MAALQRVATCIIRRTLFPFLALPPPETLISGTCAPDPDPRLVLVLTGTHRFGELPVAAKQHSDEQIFSGVTAPMPPSGIPSTAPP